ncbi:hypothetical protein PROFUN_09453 [Planoprotostelium fungivorum]|uniref:Uncharacterized protein n=1 Tax=Planoprotostelium fungivorum TaxID=1890364 RepID=A0A2P6NH24_9EUKA|nr:hypothetical protein PROFUN_09453 [Planoprotostelium fungivorum]
MTDPNLPTMRTRINGFNITLAEKTWAQKELDAHPDLATTWTPEIDVNLIAFIKQSATQSPPGPLRASQALACIAVALGVFSAKRFDRVFLKLKQQRFGRHHNEYQYGDTGDRRALSLSPSKNILVESIHSSNTSSFSVHWGLLFGLATSEHLVLVVKTDLKTHFEFWTPKDSSYSVWRCSNMRHISQFLLNLSKLALFRELNMDLPELHAMKQVCTVYDGGVVEDMLNIIPDLPTEERLPYYVEMMYS